jgi:2-polyprenyl-3-methyl-5-hydroxy-6-metoxy-1,4-benzoquinol methylase
MVGARMSVTELRLDFPACLAADFPSEVPAAARAVQCVVDAVRGRDVSSLAEHSPELAAFDWNAYLRCSIARMAHIAGALRRRSIAGGRMLDYGSYFGNCSLMFSAAGFSVDAIDSYRRYGTAFEPVRGRMRDAGVSVLDFDDVGRDLHGLEESRYDVVLCLGVIEHIPHTPRLLLQSLSRVLKPGGCLVLDTPNHAYIYHRQRLSRGESVMASLEAQFASDPPFEGHHREYTPREIAWMLRRSGHGDISIELFNYSVYALTVLTGEDLANYWATALDPEARELIMSVSIKAGAAGAQDGGERFEETEPSWVAGVPADVRDQLKTASAASLGVKALEGHYAAEIATRDREIADAHERIGALQRQLDAGLSARLARAWKRAFGG